MKSARYVLTLCALLAPLTFGQNSRQLVTQQTIDTSNLPQQKIGPDDLVGVSVYDAPELTRTVRVAADGAIRLPMLRNRINAAGLMPAELEIAIATALRKEEILVDPIVSVSAVEYRSRPISLAGAVKKPITFQAFGRTTLLEALAKAEGLAENAGPEILISHQQQKDDGEAIRLVRRISIKALLEGSDAELNVALSGGEEIRVPEAARVYVMGNVRKPGSFPIQESSETSVMRVLALSEGLMPFAGKMAYIYRTEGGQHQRNEIPIELKSILDRKTADVPLLANDILYIPDNSGRRTTMSVIDRIANFGAGTASGMLVWRR
jgi:polysaccharide biosynthesis/export protein